MTNVPGSVRAVTPTSPTVKANGGAIDQPAPLTTSTASKRERELEAKLAAMEARATAAEAKAARPASGGLGMKVSEKKAISITGLGRFPVTLYWQQWYKVFILGTGWTDEQFWASPIGLFIIDHQNELSTKE